MTELTHAQPLKRYENHVGICREKPPVRRICTSGCDVTRDRLCDRQVRTRREALLVNRGWNTEDAQARQAAVCKGV